MAEEVKMEPVELTPVEAAEPPKVNPLGAASPTATLKPGLKLPPKPGATATLKPGLKLPPKPGATVSLKPGLKLPPKPGSTVAMKPGLKLPPKPVIRKPGSTVLAKPLPKPVVANAPAVVKPPEAEVKPVEKPVSVDAQGVGKLPTVEAKTVDRAAAQEPIPEPPKAMETLKSVTQKLKGITQEIPQQAILRKTGIIAEGVMSEAQKEAAKHKTARISLSDAMGVAPVKNENAPMKTIRIKRPIDIPGATKPLAPQTRPEGAAAEPKKEVSTTAETVIAEPKDAPAEAAAPSATITQRKTLKISRPGVVRPSGKFGIKRPGATAPAANPAEAAPAAAAEGDAPIGDIPEIADIPEMPNAAVPPPPPMPVVAASSDGPVWLWVLSSLVQAAACVALGALAWFLYQNTQIAYF